MKIRKSNSPLINKPTKASKTSCKGKAGFKDALDSTVASTPIVEVRASQTTESVEAVEAISSVLIVQEDETNDKNTEINRAGYLLDQLEILRREILLGGVTALRLENIRQTVERMNSDPLDEDLKQILKEVELRVRVEIAKYSRR